MAKLSFKTNKITEGPQDKRIQIVINIVDSQFEISVALGDYAKYEEVVAEINDLKAKLDGILNSARPFFEDNKEQTDMSPQGLWEKICAMKDEEVVSFFNGLPVTKRIELADFIFSHSNVFSGKGRLFSERYDQKNSLLV